MSQPTLPSIPSGAAKISFFDHINGQKIDIRLRKSMFFRNVQLTESSFVALVWKSQVPQQVQRQYRRRRMAATGENMAKPPILDPNL